jgi:thiamine biosynthesis lipoprotein ApbE
MIPLRDAAVSTSGNYENFFEVNGRRYSHILDPRSGLPVQGLAACTVIAPTCMESDAWATAAFVYGVSNTLARFGDRLAVQFTPLAMDGRSLGKRIASPSFPLPIGR